MNEVLSDQAAPGVAATGRTAVPAAARLLAPSRWRPWEIALWLLIWAMPVVFGQHAALINEIAILALFALSLDLILGYAGIVSLGHAAFFGVGAYGAALFAKHVMPDPLVGLAVGTALGAVLGIITSPMIVRGTDLTRLMVTMGVALVLLELANKFDTLTGGADGLQGVVMGPLLGHFEFDLGARVGSFYSLAVLFAAFLLLRRIVHSPLGVSMQALRDNRLRLMAIGLSVQGRLAAVYTLAAALAGAAGALLAQTTGFASLDVLEFHRSADVMLALVIGGAGWLWGGLIGAIAFKVMHDVLSAFTPQYWTFWIGVFLVVLMLVGRERLFRPRRWFGRGLQ
ncbi:branched-chain amino acid ABC transporter permease [Aquabacterium sp.]|uniref:branched-chain amino acid ABC transporter permease n=1 Tax=Aquabacterium sp. TaxID=1872578 RepID=UPI002C529DBD|nr:branched-chain amino acid ABC transporter permease [Aquabacterium sp.]HSW05157.1 branched-chain amino acid ABC transporter permease [Aquabacterium sp.]